MNSPRPRIMVVRGDSFGSRAIEGFGGGWPSHMANMLEDGSFWDARNDDMCVEKVWTPSGVRHRPPGYLQAANSRWAIFTAPLGSERLYAAWVAALTSQEGKPYDRVGIMAFAEGMLTGRYVDRNWGPLTPADSKAWFCDEYATWAAGSEGLLPWPIPVPLFRLIPGSALNLFIGAGWELTDSRDFI